MSSHEGVYDEAFQMKVRQQIQPSDSAKVLGTKWIHELRDSYECLSLILLGSMCNQIESYYTYNFELPSNLGKRSGRESFVRSSLLS